MRIQFVNDLHMEFGYTPEIKRFGEVLSVAGDLTNWAQRQRGVDWLANEAQYFDAVFFVLGNHEYYGAPSFTAVPEYWGAMNRKLPKNCHVLQGDMKQHGDIAFIGDTLWTGLASPFEFMDFPRVMRDAQVCPGLTAHAVNAANLWARDNIEGNMQVAQNLGLKTFVITHHLPTEAITSPAWVGNAYNCFFANKPGWAENLNADYWHFGHTHDTIDTEYEGTRYICNPFGYKNYAENLEYDNTKVIDV